MKYFILKTKNDSGTEFIKTVAQTEEIAINNFCKCYNAPFNAVLDVQEIPKELFSMNARNTYKKIINSLKSLKS